MNKLICKKYIKKAYNNLVLFNKDITEQNMEEEMKYVIDKDIEEYIAYSKIAVNNMKNSCLIDGIKLKSLLSEIDILPQIYTKVAAIEKAKKL